MPTLFVCGAGLRWERMEPTDSNIAEPASSPEKTAPVRTADPGKTAALDEAADPGKALAPAEKALASQDAPDAESADALADGRGSATLPAPADQAGQAPGRPVVIIMHASVGSGHRSAANAIAQAFQMLAESDDESVPANVDVEVLDVLDWGRVRFDGDKAASLFTGFTRPIYDLTWRYTFTGRLLWGGGTVWSRIMFPAFTEHVREKRPCAIICTHITAANVAVGARMLTGQDFPIVCVPTDYETEGLWPHLHSDLFCVASESMAETLRPRRVPEERIRITGIPTREDFRKAYDKRAVREQLGLPQDKQVVLALAGAYLPRPYVRFRETLDKVLPYLHSFPNLHLVIVAGNDQDYARHLRSACADLGIANATVLDYVEQMAALMAASDLVICKSGGLTVTECLCAQVPMVLLGKAYGQENINVRTLTALGAAMHATTARELIDTLRHISRNPSSTHAMLINGSFLRKPDAARDIAHAAMELARTPSKEGDPVRRKRFMHFYWGKKPAHIR